MAQSKVAGRYAKSLYQMAKESQSTDLVLADMELYLHALISNRDLAAAMHSPIIAGLKKLDILLAIFENRFQKITNLFIRLVVSKGRETELKEIAESYLHEYKRQLGIKEGKLITASALTEENRTALYAKAEKMAGSKVSITEKIDPTLIGGYILNVNDVQLDESVKTKLTKLREVILDQTYVAKI